MSRIQTYKAKNLSEYLLKIDDIQKSFAINGECPHLWYRGHANQEYKLIPGIQREFGTNVPEKFFEHERKLNNDFQSRASVFFEKKPPLSDFSSWLTLMQHYRLPTRLLDWSRSPLFSLYFATQNTTYNRDGTEADACVWVIQPRLLNRYANLERDGSTYIYHMEHNVIKELIYPAFRRVTDNYKNQFGAQRHACKGDYVKRYNEKFNNKIAGCYATECDMRVFNQQSAFTIHNSLESLQDIHKQIFDEFQNDAQHTLLTKIMIPAANKRSIFDKLYNSGITHSTVFPDLEHVAMDIMRMAGL